MVARSDPDHVFIIGGTREDAEKFCDNDFKIRSGLCPNCPDTLLQQTNDGQYCNKCRFSTNARCELNPV